MNIPDSFSLQQSRALYKRACRVIPGGVNASARLNPAFGHSIFMQRGQGAYLWDVDGNRYIDYYIGANASLLGSGHPVVDAAIREAIDMGTLMAHEVEMQVKVAERILPLFPGSDMLRYTCSGTETTWHAVRVARAYTGKMGVAKFEGHYHGANDTLGYSHWSPIAKAGPADRPYAVPMSAGTPSFNDDLITVLPFNDVEALETCLRAKKDEIGTLIMEPIVFDSGCIMPQPGFIEAVRDLTRELGIVLIFDEIQTGFRLRLGAVFAETGIVPDMTTIYKSVDGGMPISAFMGKKEIMETCTPTGPAVHSGTYNAPPVCIYAMQAALDVMSEPGFYERLHALGEQLYSGMREIFERRGLTCWVQGVGPTWGMFFGLDQEPQCYRDIVGRDLDMLARFHKACLKRGVYMHHMAPNYGFSCAHTEQDIQETLDAMDQAAKEIAA